MIIVAAVKILGLVLLSGLWLFFYYREHQWWILCFVILGFLATLLQVTPISSQSKDVIAGIYFALVIIIPGVIRGFGYHPKNPIKL